MILKNIIKKLKNFFSFDDIELEDFIHFISNGESLPEPLSAEKEETLLKLLSLGDKSVKGELIEHNLRLVVFIAKKFIPTGHHIDDLVSIGSIGLIKAVNSYNLDKNIKLATYASRCIENEILMYLRKTAKLKNEVSLDEPVKKGYDGNEMYLSDLIPNAETDSVIKPYEQNEEKRLLIGLVKQLPAREEEIMCMRFGLEGYEEKTQKEVADFLGISQSYISRLEKKILSKLKKDLTKIFG